MICLSPTIPTQPTAVPREYLHPLIMSAWIDESSSRELTVATFAVPINRLSVYLEPEDLPRSPDSSSPIFGERRWLKPDTRELTCVSSCTRY